MGAFIREYQNLLVSLAVLLIGLAAFAYSAIYSPAKVAATDLQLLQKIFAQENQAMQKQVEAQKKKADAAITQEDVAIRSLPNFLRHINDIAKKTKVVIRELSPVSSRGVAHAGAGAGPDIKFTLKIITDYYTFLRFAAELESLNVLIDDLQVRPYDPTKRPPEHAIEFTIMPRADAQPLSGERLERLKAAVDAVEKRNPFQRFAWDKEPVRGEIELTWIMRLTGIGRVGDQRVATIDSRDYRIGDLLNGMKVVEILGDRVRLEKATDHGIDKYVLKFRASGGTTGGAGGAGRS